MAKVLLVEDDNNLREIYQARLTAEGYEISTAQNGEEALSVAKQQHPDLIISDVMMPRISGFEMLDIIRNTEELKNVKVIMLTALGQAEDRTRASGLGADKYLVKSQVTLEDIVNCAHDLLGQGPALAAAPAPDQTAQAPAAAPVAPEETQTQAPAAAPPAAPAATEKSDEKPEEAAPGTNNINPSSPLETDESDEASGQPTAARDQKILAHDAPAFSIPPKPALQADALAADGAMPPSQASQVETPAPEDTAVSPAPTVAAPTVTQITALDPSNPTITVMPNASSAPSETSSSASFQADESAIQSQIDAFTKQAGEPLASPSDTSPTAVIAPSQDPAGLDISSSSASTDTVQPQPDTAATAVDNTAASIPDTAAPEPETTGTAPSAAVVGSDQVIAPTIIRPTAAQGSDPAAAGEPDDSDHPRTANIDRSDDALHAAVAGKKVIQPPSQTADAPAAPSLSELVAKEEALASLGTADGQSVQKPAPAASTTAAPGAPQADSSPKPGFDPNSISL